MANWVQLDGSSAFPFTEIATPLIESLQEPLEIAAAAALTLSNAFDPLLPLLAAASDPLKLLRVAIDELIEDLVNSGISALVIGPDLFDKPTRNVGTDGFLRTIKQAMNDNGDINRPDFKWGDSSGGILFMISAPSFEEIAALAETLAILFGPAWTDLIDFVKSAPIITPHVNYEVSGQVAGIPPGADGRVQFTDSSQNHMPTQQGFDPYKGQQITMFTGRNVGITKIVESFDNKTKVFTLKPGFKYPLEEGDDYALSYVVKSAPPDWATVRMVDIIPPVSAVAEVMASIRDALPIIGSTAVIERLIQLLKDKAVLFATLANNLSALIDLLNQLTNIPTIAMLSIPPQDGGNQGFMQEAFAASNPPDTGANDYTVGVVLYGGSGVFDTLKKVFPI